MVVRQPPGLRAAAGRRCSGIQAAKGITHNATKGTTGLIDDTYNQMLPKSDEGSLSGLNLITGL
jgi:hypothetical protein